VTQYRSRWVDDRAYRRGHRRGFVWGLLLGLVICLTVLQIERCSVMRRTAQTPERRDNATHEQATHPRRDEPPYPAEPQARPYEARSAAPALDAHAAGVLDPASG
jgi:hypothetical protein